MSIQRSSTVSPLRDRLLSNSPDPVQSSIRRDSAKGWGKSSSPTSNLGTTPLRIAKREGKPPFPAVARRSSSSYKHVRNNNLVSKSPFKTQIPTPSRPSTSLSSDTNSTATATRRVSGEKRPRPDSMHEQAENERPLAFKRERRQSKAYQGLIEKEPVTKSPFKRTASSEEEQPPPVPPKPTSTPSPPLAPTLSLAPSSPPANRQATPSRPITPSRSSLVSKRLHGPRAADQPSMDGKRQRRKTVTFDERCDVLEFDRDEDEGENPLFSSDEDDYGEPDEHDDMESYHSQGQADAVSRDGADQDSFESIQLGDADQSITGIVDAMMQSASASVPGLGLPSTPSRHPSLPADFETEDGVPYGRSHHAERARRRVSVSSPATSIPGFPFHESEGSDEGSPSTPPRTAESSMDISSGFEIPLDRPPHLGRAHQDHELHQVDEDVNMIPPSPSPAKNPVRSEHSNRDSLIPRFELQLPKNESSPKGPHVGLPSADLFSHPRVKEEPHLGELSITSFDDPMDPANLSIGQSEVSLSNLDLEAELQKVLHANQPDPKDNVSRLSDLIPHNSSFRSSTPPPLTPPLSFAGVSSDSSYISANERSVEEEGSPTPYLASASRMSSASASTSGSPIVTLRPTSLSGVTLRRSSGSPSSLNLRRRSDSPLNLPSGLPAAQQRLDPRRPATRISRENVQMRLMRKRSTESPLGSRAPEQAVEMEEQREDIGPGKREERQDNASSLTDISADLATIQTAEKRALNSANVNMEGVVDMSPADNTTRDGVEFFNSTTTTTPVLPRPAPVRPQSSFGMLETSFDTGGALGLGLHDSMGSVQLGEMRSALDRLMDNVNGSSGSSTKKRSTHSEVRVEVVTEGIKAGKFDGRAANMSSTFGDESTRTETDMDFSTDEIHGDLSYNLLKQRLSSVDEYHPDPGPPVKDAIKAREQLILERRREARRREEDESMGYYTPPRPASQPPSTGRPSRRRSRSTGDAGALTKNDLLLDIGLSETEDDLLADSITKELRKLDPDHRQGNYRVREHEAIFASADAEQISHMSLAGDVNGGKAWKAVRRPSDMNEYAKQIKEYRSQEKPGKAHGKVFGLNIPIPQQATALACTLNNGIHFVTTPETRLSKDTRINQEFELIEHNKLEFTMTLKIRRDPHIAAQFKALAPPAPPPQPAVPPPKSKSGMFSFLSSSPKKPAARATPPPPALPHKLPDNLARYLKQDGTLARAFISFKDVAARCDTRLFEISYPLIGQRAEASGGATTMELGEIVLQLFRLPSLPGVLSNQLPQSLDECLRGLRHVAWHKVTYFEGTLTQNGGDCTTWRRRKFRVTGANLIAFNDVTKKATATINLKKAIASHWSLPDDYDSLYAVERSFKLQFPGDQEILFFADSDEEKARWLEVLRALVGHIPPNPLWAELIWQRQQEMAKQRQPSSSATPSS
ncbi:hypothetical protein BU15DRAFT_72306 [Melanogaster broomeanus]|nr:hypothetical protein BU15DRAFT_72306 [Melanogaster broomeanus]